MSDQWEYKILNSGLGGAMQLRDEGGAEYGKFTEATLNRLGEEGWEVAGYTNSGLVPILILKRRRNEGQRGDHRYTRQQG